MTDRGRDADCPIRLAQERQLCAQLAFGQVGERDGVIVALAQLFAHRLAGGTERP